MRKGFYICGVLAFLIYTGAVIVGGLITPNYSHVHHAISELFDAGAPAKAALDPWFLLYNALLMAFGLGLWSASRQYRVGRMAAGAYCLLVSGVFGLLTNLYFPMDPRGAAPTLAGVIHLILAGGTSVLTVVSVTLCGLGFGEVAPTRPLRRYSFATAILILLSAGVAAPSAAGGWSIMGLAERLTIGAFLQWPLVVGLYLAKQDFAEPSRPPVNV